VFRFSKSWRRLAEMGNAAMIHRRAMLAAAGLVFGAGAARAAARGFNPRDLQGCWDLGSWTELERPSAFSGLVARPAEIEAFMAPRRAMHGLPASKPGEVGQAENEYIDKGVGLARVKGELRSSTIVDPPDGRLPYNARGEALAGPRGPIQGAVGDLINPETMGGTTRCMATVAAGAPMLGAPDTNVIQVVQTKACLAIQSEKYHDVRIVRLVAGPKAAAAAPRDPPSWMGTSYGWWEGETLCVATDCFHEGVITKGQRILVSGATKVSERLTRVSTSEILYQFTVEDPELLTRPWRGEQTIRASTGRVFEYACHEGNYSMAGMLAGARLEEREAKGAGGK
jgi:hypothetical protein